MTEASLICKPPLEDDPEYTREIVRIDPSIFDKFKLADFDYVKLLHDDREHIVRIRKIGGGDGAGIIRIRKSYIDLLNLKYDEEIVVQKIEDKRLILNTFYSYAKDKKEHVVRIHQKKLEELGILSDDSKIEIFNLNDGGRRDIKVKPLEEEEENRIRMDAYTRTLLCVSLGDDIGVRRGVLDYPKKHYLPNILSNIKIRIGKFFINYNTLTLKVCEGEDSDEGKNVVRTDKNNIKIIGTEPGDIVDVRWQDKNLKCRILENFDSGNRNIQQEEICICSSERSCINVDKYDCVQVSRDPFHIFKKNIVEPFIGAIITGFGLFYSVLELELLNVKLWAILAGLIFSLISFYLILFKVRSQV